MATNLQRRIVQFNLGSVVNNAIASVRAAKNEHFSEVEASFQQAVADGSMGYDAQIAFREKQLEREKKSPFVDEEMVKTIDLSISKLKKLNKFQKYRERYTDSFSDLNAGRITTGNHLALLKDQLSMATDPDLILEIRQNIVQAEADEKEYQDSIFSNRVKLAQYDGTKKVLESAIADVNNRKAQATVVGNEAEITALDNTLLALGSQLSTVKISDRMIDVEVASTRKGLLAQDKLAMISDELSKADANSPVKIDGQNYPSARAYWEQLRGNYIAGIGTGQFKDFISELDAQYTQKINSAVSRDGYATANTLDNVKREIDQLKARPELAPYKDRLETLQTAALSYGFQSTQKTIVERSDFTGDYENAVAQLKDFSAKFGVDSSGALLTIGNRIVQKAESVRQPAEPFLKDAGVAPDSFQTPSAKLSAPTKDSTVQQLADYALNTGATDLQSQDWWNSQSLEKRQAAWSIVQKSNGSVAPDEKKVEPAPSVTSQPSVPVQSPQPITDAAALRKQQLGESAKKRTADLTSKGVSLSKDVLNKTGSQT